MQPFTFFRRGRLHNEMKEVADAATHLGACPPRICAKGKDCVPYATSCVGNDTRHACNADACCVTLDLDVINSNIPGRALPEASIQRCGTKRVYCSSAGAATPNQPGVCARTVPDWSDL